MKTKCTKSEEEEGEEKKTMCSRKRDNFNQDYDRCNRYTMTIV